jgi:hypothetical protein
MRYLISYDLNVPGHDYQMLFDELERLGAKRLLQSQWITPALDETFTALGLRDRLWALMQYEDRLLVASLNSTHWAGMNLMVQVNTV